MNNELAPAIAVLERRLQEAERKVNELRGVINVLCAEAGLPPKYPDGGGPGGGGSDGGVLSQITDDTFYGKKQSTAMRTYLEMRKAQGAGPAKPREIFDALKLGGYVFETKDDQVALVGLRALLRKNTTTFHKLPTGAYGLLSWYPNAKVPKADTEKDEVGDDDEHEEEHVAVSETATAAPLKKKDAAVA